MAGFGVEAEADRIGTGMMTVAGVGVAAHAIYTWAARRSAARAIRLTEKEPPKEKGPQA